MGASDGDALSEQVVEKVQDLSHQCLSRRNKQYPKNKWGRYLRKYDDRLQKIPGKHEREEGGKYFATRCIGCKSWMHNHTSTCPVCGNSQVRVANKQARPSGRSTTYFLLNLLALTSLLFCGLACLTLLE